jgi:hypothetical protein
MRQAKNDYDNDSSSTVKKQAYEDAKKAYDKAKLDRELLKYK